MEAISGSQVFTLAIICAIIGGLIGRSKGVAVDGICWGMLLGPIGIIIILFSRGNRQQPYPFCRELIHREASACPRCQQVLTQDPRPQEALTGLRNPQLENAGKLAACALILFIAAAGANSLHNDALKSRTINAPFPTWTESSSASTSSKSTKGPATQDATDAAELDRIKEKLKRDYPDDYMTQSGVYDMQVEALKYMKTVPASRIKEKLVRDYPHDYVTQKGVYEMQVEAKEYMDSLPDSKLKAKMQRDYPNDYVTQKGVYDMELEAKRKMN